MSEFVRTKYYFKLINYPIKEDKNGSEERTDEHEVTNTKRIKNEDKYPENTRDEHKWVFIKMNGKYSCYSVKDDPIDTIRSKTNLTEDQIASEDGILWFDEDTKVELEFKNKRLFSLQGSF